MLNLINIKYCGYGIEFDSCEIFCHPSGGTGRNLLSVEKIYSINFTENNKKICFSLHYNGASSYLFINGTKIYKFKAKVSETVATPLCLGNISKDWTVDNMEKTGLNECLYDFSVDYDAIAVDNMLDIHKYLMKKNNMT